MYILEEPDPFFHFVRLPDNTVVASRARSRGIILVPTSLFHIENDEKLNEKRV